MASYNMSSGRGAIIPMQNGHLRRTYSGHENVDADTIPPSGSLANSLGQPSAKQLLDDEIQEQAAPSSRDVSIMEQEGHLPQVGGTQLSRKLKERHVNMFAFSLLVGSGLFLQNGQVIYLAGPGVAFLAYPAMILVIWAVMGALGEMTALFPVPGALFELPARFLDESIGYAAGWMAWFSWVVIFAAELDAVATLFNFEFTPQYLQEVNYPRETLQWSTQGWNPAIWVTLFMPLSIMINLLPIKLYGEFEYCVGVIKMVFCVVLIVFQMAINIELNLGARYYRSPFSFITQSFPSQTGSGVPSTGNLAQLKGVWSGICVSLYSLIGFESISITAAESEEFDDRQRFATKEGLKISTRKIAIRILMIYTLSTLVVSFNVPVDDENLKESYLKSFGGGENSAFVIAAVRARKTVWPSLMNGFFVFTTTSASINSLYLSSRLLHALALSRPVWPDYDLATKTRSWLAQVTRNGVPRNAVLVSSVFGLLGYLACSKNQGEALSDLATNSVISMLIVYVVICATFLKFKASLRNKLGSFHSAESGNQRGSARVFDREARDSYPYKSRGQPARAVVAGIICTVVVFFNGWASIEPFKPRKFFASYISVAIFAAIWLAYRTRAWRQPATKLWKLAPTGDMSRPTRVHRMPGNPGRDHLNLDVEKFWSTNNMKKVKSWLWVWLK